MLSENSGQALRWLRSHGSHAEYEGHIGEKRLTGAGGWHGLRQLNSAGAAS